MDEHALRDYDYVEWNGRSHYAAALPSQAPAVIDTTNIFLGTEREMRYWTSELGVTIYTLRDAIAAAGTRATAIVRALLDAGTH